MNIKKLRMNKIVLVIAAIATMAWATGMVANAGARFGNTPDNLMPGEGTAGGDIMYIPVQQPQKLPNGLCIKGYVMMEDGAITVPIYQKCR